MRLREHVECTGVPSAGRRGNLGDEDHRAVWGCGGTRSRAQGRDLGQEGEQIHLQRPTWLLEGGEAILGWKSAKSRARGWPREAHPGGLPFLSPNSLLPSSFPASTVGGPLVLLRIK